MTTSTKQLTAEDVIEQLRELRRDESIKPEDVTLGTVMKRFRWGCDKSKRYLNNLVKDGVLETRVIVGSGGSQGRRTVWRLAIEQPSKKSRGGISRSAEDVFTHIAKMAESEGLLPTDLTPSRVATKTGWNTKMAEKYLNNMVKQGILEHVQLYYFGRNGKTRTVWRIVQPEDKKH